MICEWCKGGEFAGSARYCSQRCANNAKCKRWRDRHPEANRANARRQYEKVEPARNRARVKAWQEANPTKRQKLRLERIEREKLATPAWLTKAERRKMVATYKAAALLSKKLGLQLEVDHVIPIKGSNVSGLHVPWNLQILTRQQNQRKNIRCSVAG